MGQQVLRSINPYTKQVIGEFQQFSSEELDSKLDLAVRTYQLTRKLSVSERKSLFLRTAEALMARKEELAMLAVREMGKTITAARAEVDKCEWACRIFSETLDSIVADRKVKQQQLIRVLPIGCVLAIMPWNFPYWQVFRAALAALSTGNTMVLKHASNVSGCALAIEKIFLEAGWPKGSFQTLLLSSDRVKDVISDSRIAAVTLTGSETAGRAVASVAGSNLKKSVLELGGSDAFIVRPDADVQAAALAAAKSRTINNGQSCIAAKRFIIDKKIARNFFDTFISTLQKMKVGDPLEETTEIGPLVNEKAFSDLADQIKRCELEGVEVLLRPNFNSAQNIFSPAVVKVPLAKVNKGVFAEEFFGPVALCFETDSLDQSIAIANESNFGLGSSFWSQSEQEVMRAINEIEAGMTFINSIVASEPQLPFGGIKSSGYGRELGLLGPLEFTNLKSISISKLDSFTVKVGD
jgi:succinate-semialdehyde dehydrogenase / glutarate-semialdehyde dehydrogenase